MTNYKSLASRSGYKRRPGVDVGSRVVIDLYWEYPDNGLNYIQPKVYEVQSIFPNNSSSGESAILVGLTNPLCVSHLLPVTPEIEDAVQKVRDAQTHFTELVASAP